MRIIFELPKSGGLLRAHLLCACACARFLCAWFRITTQWSAARTSFARMCLRAFFARMVCVCTTAGLVGAGIFIFADGGVSKVVRRSHAYNFTFSNYQYQLVCCAHIFCGHVPARFFGAHGVWSDYQQVS